MGVKALRYLRAGASAIRRSGRWWAAPGAGEPLGGGGAGVLVRWLPAVAIAVAVVLDVALPTHFTGAAVFSAAPLLAAPFYSAAGTAVAGLVSLAAVTAMALNEGNTAGSEQDAVVLTVLFVSALAVFISVLIRRTGVQTAAARLVAEKVRRAVLPWPADRVGELRVAARYEPTVGAAYFDGGLFAVQDTPSGVCVLVGDVGPKGGLETVQMVAVLVGAFREAADQESSLEGIVERLERALDRERARRGSGLVEESTTVVLAEIPPATRMVRLLNRGHPQPLLLAGDGTVRVMELSAPTLGFGTGRALDGPDHVHEMDFPAGSTLLFHTEATLTAREAERGLNRVREQQPNLTRLAPGDLLDLLITHSQQYKADAGHKGRTLLALHRASQPPPWPG